MEEQAQVTTKSVGIKYGLIAALISIILFILIDFLGMVGQSWTQWVGILITAVIIFLAHKEFKSEGDDFMSYGQGVGIGVWIGLISSVLGSVFTYIYVKFINPGYMDFIREQQIMGMEERGMSDAEIEQAMKMAESFSGPEAILIFGIIFGFIFTLIAALIVSAVTKNSRPELV